MALCEAIGWIVLFIIVAVAAFCFLRISFWKKQKNNIDKQYIEKQILICHVAHACVSAGIAVTVGVAAIYAFTKGESSYISNQMAVIVPLVTLVFMYIEKLSGEVRDWEAMLKSSNDKKIQKDKT